MLQADGFSADVTKTESVTTITKTVVDIGFKRRRRLVVRLCPTVCKLLEPCYSDYYTADLLACKEPEDAKPGDPPTCISAQDACKKDLTRMGQNQYFVSFLESLDPTTFAAKYGYTQIMFKMDEEDSLNCFSAGSRAAPLPPPVLRLFVVLVAALVGGICQQRA